MKLSELKLAVVYINLAHREDRRHELDYQLARLGWSAVRQPGIRAGWVRDPWGFQNDRRYACSLAKRMAIRRGMRTGADAVLLLEDDVVLDREILTRLDALDLPEEWGLLYLGCRHFARPEVHGPGLLKCTKATDNHAIVVRRSHYRQVMRGLAGTKRGAQRTVLYSDWQLAQRQGTIPSYAAFPNLAWQAYSWSDTGNRPLTAYHPDGRQAHLEPVMEEVADEMRRRFYDRLPTDGEALVVAGQTGDEEDSQPVVESARTIPPQEEAGADEPPGFQFLKDAPSTYGFEESFPMRTYINLSRREDRRKKVTLIFASQGLSVERFPAVDGRWVKNPRGHGPGNVYACRLSHRLLLRQARQRKEPAVLICEDDVVLNPDFRQVAEALPLPEDWGIIFFGCTHVKTPEVVAPGWVKVVSLWSSQAYAVKDVYFNTVLHALNAKGVEGREEGADVILSRLAGQIPMYAVYPNIAWQGPGFSDLKGRDRQHFRRDGQQNQLRHVLRPANLAMRRVIEGEYGPQGGSEISAPGEGPSRRSNQTKMADERGVSQSTIHQS